MSQLEWSELGVSGLPTGTVTLLLADVEGSTRLWETQPGDMTSAIARRTTLSDLVAVYGGVRPIEQGEGALTTRAHVAMAQGEVEQAECDAHDALSCAAEVQAYQVVPDALEILAEACSAVGGHREAARFGGAAEAIRERMGGMVRFPIYEPRYEKLFATIRDATGHDEFGTAWAEGAAMSVEEAIAYAQRGRGVRKRPSSGWAALTPTELDVVRLVTEGLGNKEIAARIFMSHRTVQTHLTHVYAKLGLTSRVALAQEAARHG